MVVINTVKNLLIPECEEEKKEGGKGKKIQWFDRVHRNVVGDKLFANSKINNSLRKTHHMMVLGFKPISPNNYNHHK
jgi:hypothetical protein